MHARGIPSLGIWVQVPHYITSMSYPASSVALLDALREVADIVIDAAQIRQEALIQRGRLDKLVADNAEHVQMLVRLEELYDSTGEPTATPAPADRSSSCAPATSSPPSSSSSSGTRTERKTACRSTARSEPISPVPAAMPQELEAVGYTGVWTAETAHDPFLPLVLAAEHTDRAPARHVDRRRLRPQPDDARQHRLGPAALLRRAVHARSRQPDQAAHHQALLDGVEPPGAADARDGARHPGDLGHVAERHAARSSAASSTRTR